MSVVNPKPDPKPSEEPPPEPPADPESLADTDADLQQFLGSDEPDGVVRLDLVDEPIRESDD
jgi:hypothetical protein